MRAHQMKMLQYEAQIRKSKPKISEPVEPADEHDVLIVLNKIDAEKLAKHFSEAEMLELDSMSILKKSDREFVGKALTMLYKNRPEELFVRTIKNEKTKKLSSGKKMTPEKKHLIHALMNQRLDKVQDETEKAARSLKLYIDDAISRALRHERNSRPVTVEQK